MTSMNRRVLLVRRPPGIAQAEDFAMDEVPVPEIGDGEILVRNAFVSVEPAMRGWTADTNNYSEPVPLGSVMRSIGVGHVAASRDPQWREGDPVVGWFGWQDYAAVRAKAIMRRVPYDDLPISLSLGVLGLTGLTAYLALTRVGEPNAGETVLVSTAAGAVGSAVGQIATLLGCRAVGIAGGPMKAQLCTDEFGYSAAIDYKSGNLDAELAIALPDGANIYFDNTAGAISDAAHRHLAPRGRVIICGTASVPSWDPTPLGPRVERTLLMKRARMEGFIIFEHKHEFAEATDILANWVRAGKLRYREDILEGIEAAPDALAGLYRGENLGKRLIRL
jgi:NADPH-dependent curcumin reductase CurA